MRHGALSDRRSDACRVADATHRRSAVIKRNRCNGGQGVWKVERLPTSPMITVLDATKDTPEELTLDDFLRRCAEYFENGSVIDQTFQPGLSEGVVRCYMAGDRAPASVTTRSRPWSTRRPRAPRPDRVSTRPTQTRASSGCVG
jgi:hypothetical protein